MFGFEIPYFRNVHDSLLFSEYAGVYVYTIHIIH